jgi:hypothetical protein
MGHDDLLQCVEKAGPRHRIYSTAVLPVAAGTAGLVSPANSAVSQAIKPEAVAKAREQRSSPIQCVNRIFQRGRSAVDHQDQRLLGHFACSLLAPALVGFRMIVWLDYPPLR